MKNIILNDMIRDERTAEDRAVLLTLLFVLVLK
jgi:hypothetical protein